MNKTNTFYRHILAEGWEFSRTYLFLWPLAFFASLTGVAGTFQIFFDIGSKDEALSITNWYTQTDLLTSIFIGWSQSFDQIPWTSLRLDSLPFLAFFFLLLIVVIALAIIVTSSEGGIIFAIAQLQSKKQTSYLVSFRKGLDKFWSLFGINLVYRLLYLIIVTVVVLPLIYLILTSPGSARLILATVVYLILIPVIIILDLVTRYSLFYIMLYNNTVTEAFRNAWLLFITNWIMSIETSLLILAVLFVAFIIMSFVIIPLLALLFALFGSLVAFSAAALQIFSLTALVLLVLVVAAFITLFTTIQMAVWTAVFRKLTTGEQPSKIHRLLSHLPWVHRHIF